MSVPFEDFTGFSYQSLNKYAAIERVCNWYPEVNEFPGEEKKYRLQLLPSPGNAQFGQLPVPSPFNQPARGLLEYRGQVFGVNGTTIFYIDSNGIYYDLLSTAANDGNPVSMVANGNDQIFIASAGFGYVIQVAYPGNLSGVVGIGTPGNLAGASYATFQDGYIIVSTPNSNQFQISGDDTTPIGDATVWDLANVSIQAGQGDFLRAVISSREYLRLLGDRRSQIYQDVGSAGIGGFPFQSYNETFIETGIAAVFSLADLGDSLIWIGQDSRGQRACWRDYAFNPQRVSTFAVEQFWQSYSIISDAVAFAYIWNGHLMYQITFPTAGATWVYDATLSQLTGRPAWHERQYIDSNGYLRARPEQFHCYFVDHAGNGRHLVSSSGIDGNPGAVYQYSGQVVEPTDPVMLLRWSNDAGNTYGFEHSIPVGKVGQYGLRVYWNRAGYGRDRVFWVRSADEMIDCSKNLITGVQQQNVMVRDRICGHLWQQNKRVVYNRIEFECSRGIGASTPGSTNNGLGLVGAELDMVVCGS